MAVEPRGTDGREHVTQTWRVRLRDDGDNVLGAGILVGGTHVLACAHVLGSPDSIVSVDCGEPTSQTVTARIADNCWVPLIDEGRGDVALLELTRPLADELGAPLRRLPPTRNRSVYTFGNPRNIPRSIPVKATLGGSHQPRDEWIRLTWTAPGRRIPSDFTGAAVVDETTEYVIGMVVGRYPPEPADGVWMLPIETILGHISRLADWVTGAPATDRAFVRGLGSQNQNEDLARTLTSWLATAVDLSNNVTGTPKIVVQARDIHVDGNFVLLVTGDADSARSEALRRAVVLSDRELRPKTAEGMVAQAPKDTVPPIGSIDVAIDVSGRTVSEVLRLIADRMGIPLDESSTPSDQLRNTSQPITLVLDGIDDAADSDALLDAVKPLARCGWRMVLGFRRESSSVTSSARSWLSGPNDTDAIEERLDRLAARVAKLDTAEQELRERGDRVYSGLSAAPDHAVTLRTWLTGLRLAARNRQQVESALERCERAVGRALSKVHEEALVLDKFISRRDELRGLLTGYKSMAETKGLVEDIGLAALYRKAHAALWQATLDMPEAARLVDQYVQAVRRKLAPPTEAAP